jgi:aryl-alcohol dehydrogenase-like predicted oxidoreductase
LSKIFGGLPEDIDSLSDERFMKLTVNDGDMVNRVGLSRKHIFDAVDASIARLGTHLDILQIHRLDRDTPRKEIMKALNDVVESGKARYIGACTVRFFPHSWSWNFTSNLCADGHVGIPVSPKHCKAERLASIH